MSDSSKVMQKRIAGVPAIIYLWTYVAVLGKTHIFQGLVSRVKVIRTLQMSKQPRKMSIKINTCYNKIMIDLEIYLGAFFPQWISCV